MGKIRRGPDNVQSIAELKRIGARQIETHQRLDGIIDQKKAEVNTMRESLYVEIQNFREAHHAEIRRGIEVVLDLATQSLPWWKRTVLAIRGRADEILAQVNEMVKIEGDRIAAEMKKVEDEKLAAAEQAKKDQEILAAVRAGNVQAEPELPKDQQFLDFGTPEASAGTMSEEQHNEIVARTNAEMDKRKLDEVLSVPKTEADYGGANDLGDDTHEVDEELMEDEDVPVHG